MAYSDVVLPGRPVTVSLVTAPTVARGDPLNWVRVRNGGLGMGSGQPGADQIWYPPPTRTACHLSWTPPGLPLAVAVSRAPWFGCALITAVLSTSPLAVFSVT